jgi:hypothetical protein
MGVNTSQFFRDYGTTPAEILTAISDAINFIDRSAEPDTEATADRLTESAAVLRQIFEIEDV